MYNATYRAVYRVSVSLLAFGVVAAQVINGLFHPPFDNIDYFSFFSVQSDLYAASVLGILAIVGFRGESATHLTFWRGAAALYLTLAGTVYFVLLQGHRESLFTPSGITNGILHYVVPAALLADWYVFPKERIRFRQALLWLVYPLLYVLYSLVRGNRIGWYPYPFLNPTLGGYLPILATCLVMAAAMTGFIALLTHHSRRSSTRPVGTTAELQVCNGEGI